MVKKTTAETGEFSVFQIKLSLKDISPTIWRQFEVPGSYNLNKLHKVIQVLMDWSEYHLFEFKIGDIAYGIPDDDCSYLLKDARRYKLNKVLNEGQTILYTYDFGDNWLCILEIEKMDIVKRELKHPVCLDGQQASPPEDTGGPRAYAALIKLLGTAPSENEEEQQRRDWIGEDFDPAYFNLKETNQILKIIS